MFAVEDIEDVLARLQLCYVRGPEGIIVALSEKLD
jgi:hypothetical protein